MTDQEQFEDAETTSVLFRELLDYNPDTGDFTWKVSSGRVKAGSPTGASTSSDGYRQIGILGKLYLAHRVAWIITYGKWPDGQIDHINRIRHDNRICNLRDVPQHINARNAKLRADNKSGIRGVYFNEIDSCWQTNYLRNGKGAIKRFKTLEEAVAFRKDYEKNNGFITDYAEGG